MAIRTMHIRLALWLGVAALWLPTPASADQNWKTSSAVWRAMDKCNDTAHKAYPDYTPESNAKREAARKKCLRGGNLPGDASPAPAPQQPVRQQ
ncbi:MAG TPA: hypothetical protein VLV85_18950 [Stellaceae bacterium]|jgi:hypothetical protein|nr:hypothetical protein [Stellaceae bacterium]